MEIEVQDRDTVMVKGKNVRVRVHEHGAFNAKGYDVTIITNGEELRLTNVGCGVIVVQRADDDPIPESVDTEGRVAYLNSKKKNSIKVK